MAPLDDPRERAVHLRAAGLRVHPCRVRDKIPTVTAWQQQRLGAADLRAETQPDSNLGVALGTQHDGSQIVVIDCDGLRWLEWALDRFPPPVLMTQNDPDRGGHLWYRWDGPLPRKRVLARDPDQKHSNAQLLSEGAQVVVPPSIHPSGRAYRWIVDGTEDDTSAAMLALGRLPVIDAETVERAAPTRRHRPTREQAQAMRRLAATGVDLASIDLYEAHAHAGLLRGSERNGVVPVQCPWGAGHSTDAQTSTAIGRRDGGGWWWKCLHASCEHRSMTDLLDALGVDRVRSAATKTRGQARIEAALKRHEGWL
jgi:hypothetical protein